MAKKKLAKKPKKAQPKESWYTNKCDQAKEIFEAMGEVIRTKIIDRLELPSNAKLTVGPSTTSHRNSKNHTILFTLQIHSIIEVGMIHNLNAHEFNSSVQLQHCFSITPSGSNRRKAMSLDGVIEYINDIWFPDQKKRLKAVENRKEAQCDLAENVIGLAKMQFDYASIPPYFDGLLNQRYKNRTVPTDCLKYYVIADEETLKDIKSTRKKYSPYTNNDWWKNQDQDPKHSLAIVIMTRSDRNLARIVSFDSQDGKSSGYFSYWRFQRESNWFSPKNTLKQLDKHATKYPNLANLMYDPGSTPAIKAEDDSDGELEALLDEIGK